MDEKFEYGSIVWGRETPRKGDLRSSGTLIVEGILKALERTNGDVLDVGCGGGQFSRAVKKYRPDLELTGVDVGKEAIRYAKSKSEDIEYKVAKATELPFRDNRFDAAISIEVLEHIDNYQKAISEVDRILKPRGVVYLSVSCEASLWTITGILGKFGIDLSSKSFGHINKLTYSDLIMALIQKGFIIKEKFYFGHFVRQIEDLLYAIYLKRSAKKPGDLWQEYSEGGGILKKLVFLLLKMGIFLTNIESKILWWFPGISIQIIATKQ